MLVERRCVSCDTPFTYDHVGRGRYRATCSDACRLRRQREKHRAARKAGRYQYPKQKSYDARCVICSTRFLTGNRMTRTCSATCANKHRKKRTEVSRHANAMARRTRFCDHCQVKFVARNPSAAERRRGHLQRFCSVECANYARSTLTRDTVQ